MSVFTRSGIRKANDNTITRKGLRSYYVLENVYAVPAKLKHKTITFVKNSLDLIPFH